MISIPQPSAVIAADDAYPGVPTTAHYSMWKTWEGIKADVPVPHIVDWVATMADSAPDHYLRVLVINAHGGSGHISLGHGILGKGITMAELTYFAKLMDRVANIWIIACAVAYDYPFRPRKFQGEGSNFCSVLAQLTGAYVVASTNNQKIDVPLLPFGYVDGWEGDVRRFEPEHGSIDWSHEYPLRRGILGTLSPDLGPAPPIAVPPRFRASTGGGVNFSGTPARYGMPLTALLPFSR